MARAIRYHPLFECDVVEAANWYDGRSQGLGGVFSGKVKIATEAVLRHPERFVATNAGLRYVRVKRFPFIVLFHADDTEVLLLGVLHTARSIEKWKVSRR